MKKLISSMAAAAIIASLLPSAFASEITDETDANYNGYVWQDIEDAGQLAVEDSAKASIEVNTEYKTVGTGSAKIKRTGAGDNSINILLASKTIPKQTGKAVKAISIDVYVPELNDEGDANVAIDSTISGYVKTSAPDSYLNGSDSWIEARTLKAGWNTVVFDAVNGTEMPYFIWRDTSTHNGVIYVDNIRVYYQTPSSVYDSFENYDDDWKEQDGGYTLSQNTDPTYVKDGKGSLKITCPVHGDSNFIISKLEQLNNYWGRQIPLIEGYTAKTIGLWVYSDGVRGTMKPRSNSCTDAAITKDGWQYLTWTIPDGSADGYASDWFSKDHLNKIRLTVTQAGTLYVDAMSIGYEDNSVTYIDGFESFLWNAGGCYGASGYGLNTDSEYVKDGLASGKFVIPAGKQFNDGEYVYSNNEFGVSIPAAPEGQELKKIGMWVYGTGIEGTYLRPGFGIDPNNKYDNTYRPFGEIDLDFTGWRYFETDVSPETLKFYDIQAENTTENDAVFYIDKITAIYGDISKSVNIQDAAWNSNDENYVTNETQTNKLSSKDGTAQLYGYKAEFTGINSTIKSAVLNAVSKDDPAKTKEQAYSIGENGISVNGEGSVVFYIVSEAELSTQSTVTIE